MNALRTEDVWVLLFVGMAVAVAFLIYAAIDAAAHRRAERNRGPVAGPPEPPTPAASTRR